MIDTLWVSFHEVQNPHGPEYRWTCPVCRTINTTHSVNGSVRKPHMHDEYSCSRCLNMVRVANEDSMHPGDE